ncbi:MAG: type VI secretion system baseplate subunit TssG [Thiohalomonadales bacterium]
MPPQSRSKNSSIIQLLTENIHEFSFLQSVRLLERSCIYELISKSNTSKINTIAKFSPPSTEIIRFRNNQNLDFHPSEISSLNRAVNHRNNNQWRMKVNFMGLTGSMGVLPFHYSEMILQRHKLKDDSLLEFLDLFNHRTISLFYQSSVKYKLALDYERQKLTKNTETAKDSHTKVLLSLIGLGTKNLTNRLHTQDESLLFYSGLLTQTIKTSSGLKHILQRHFSIPIEISEFIGQWQWLIDDVRTKLTSQIQPKGQNACLGRSAILGRKGLFAQGKIRIILGPLNKSQLKRFAPGTKTLKALNELVRIYAGIECNYDFIIRAKRSDIPNKIVLNKNDPPILSWNAWFPKSGDSLKLNETVDIIVSANRLS